MNWRNGNLDCRTGIGMVNAMRDCAPMKNIKRDECRNFPHLRQNFGKI